MDTPITADSSALARALEGSQVPRPKAAFGQVKDSGKRQEFPTGSRRDTEEGKGRPDLIPRLLLERLGKHFENGARKYGDNNWQKGQPLSRYWRSAFRHLLSVRDGEEDEDHLSAAIWNLQAIMWTLEETRADRLPRELADLPYQLPQYQKPYDPAERKLRNTPL